MRKYTFHELITKLEEEMYEYNEYLQPLHSELLKDSAIRESSNTKKAGNISRPSYSLFN